MELFKDTRFDFLRRKWWFIVPSLVLTIAGITSLFLKGGPRYSIDFRGGAVMDVRWDTAPPVERIRSAVSSRLDGVSVVAAHDLTGSSEVLVSAAIPADSDIAALRHTIDEALSTVGGMYSIHSFEVIGPQIGADLRRQAFLATGGASAGMLLYLGWRFRLTYGLAAVAAMLHDAFITIGLFSLLNQEISITVVAALLTLIGYSMNDTIVVFDRIRENRRNSGHTSLAETINDSINQTLSRTVLTSGLTLLTAISLLLFGGSVLRGFSLALVIGIVVGTFSSIFVASPILLAGERLRTGWRASRVPLPQGGVR
ncbi:MAG TPA: protein translocase subunit SecF [Bryobacteraceae bacterium]|nr:protein translocase subunit SecF [Bryobacteraceae bacterium]